MRGWLLLLAIAATAARASVAEAQTTLELWHAVPGGNSAVLAKLAEDFNASQKEYRVVPVYKGSYPDTMSAGLAAFKAGNPPHMLQVFEVGTATMMSTKGATKPVHELMREAGERFDPKAYLPAVTSYFSTASGDMLSLPFNSSTIVLWVNKDALAKVGLDPDHPPKTWPELFAAARRLRERGYPSCGFSVAWASWAIIEQLSAWHDVPIASKSNGLDGFDAVLQFNGPLQVRHLRDLAELQKDKTFDYSGRTTAGESRFISGECPMLLSSSAFYGIVKQRAQFAWMTAPIPYYPEVKGAPQNTIIGGASIWVMSGKSALEYKGVAKFFAYLSDTDRQATLHQASGYLPITRDAYRRTKESGFYTRSPGFETAVLSLTNKEPTPNSRGLRLGNMVQLREIWAEEIEAALVGQKSAKDALDSAVARGNDVLRRFARSID